MLGALACCWLIQTLQLCDFVSNDPCMLHPQGCIVSYFGLQAAFLVAVSTLPPEFTLQVPSATPGQTYDTKTVKNW